MKALEKNVRLVIAVLVLVIVMLSLALWSSTYINNLDTYYFNEYLDSAETLEQQNKLDKTYKKNLHCMKKRV